MQLEGRTALISGSPGGTRIKYRYSNASIETVAVRQEVLGSLEGITVLVA
jgi:hypothetical protein